MSRPLHAIQPLRLEDTFLDLYTRVNDTISVVNAIKLYDIQGTGGIIHKRLVNGNTLEGYTREVLQLNLAVTGGGVYGYGLGLISLSNPDILFEGGTYALRFDYNNLQSSTAFVGVSGATVYVEDTDLVAVAATGSRGDGSYRPRKVQAKDSLPYNIDGDHRFRGNVFFDGSQVVVNAGQLHIDDRLLFIASAGNTDNPESAAGLVNNAILAGGSGSGFVIKGLSGDKFFAYQSGDTSSNYYSFVSSENIQLSTNKGFVSPTGQFKFVGISGSAPAIAIRTAGQDSSTNPLGWSIYQSATGSNANSLKFKREGITDLNALELFNTSEVKIGTFSEGTGGDGSFRTEAAKFSIPATRTSPILHHSWQNRDLVELKATGDGGLFAEPTSVFKPGTVLTFNSLGQYKRARWDAEPADGYKDAEVVGIIEKLTSDDYLLTVPVHGASYNTSIFSQYETVSLIGNGKTIKGYVYDTLPASGLSGIKVFVDTFPSGVTKGWFTIGGQLFVGGATLYGSADQDLIGVCGSRGITVADINNAIIVRQGVFELTTDGSGATGYNAVTGLTAGYLFYLGGTLGGNDNNCYGGVTYSPNNLFDPEVFYRAGANVAKPLFIYLGNIGGKRLGLFQHYQGLGLTYSVTSYDLQPVYYDNDTQEIQNFDVVGEVSGRNKIMNSGLDYWIRLDAAGSIYNGIDNPSISGVTFRSTIRQVYPFGATYTDLTSTGQLVSGYISDGYFFDTLNRPRSMFIRKQQVSGSLPKMVSPPLYELKMTQVSDTGRARLYSIVPDHRTISDHDMNFSFYARSDSAGTLGITAGVAFVWRSGSTYAKIEQKGAFISSGTGVSGGTGYRLNLSNTYNRYTFAFSSEGLSYPGATGIGDSFIAPFIEIGTLATNESLYVTGFQLSKGMTPKPYERKSTAQEKMECDRFFQNVIIGGGGYYPISTGNSGPSIFTTTNLQVSLAQTPTVAKVIDIQNRGLIAAATGDVTSLKRNYASVFRNTDTSSSTYHRYFETLYSLDASGFSGTVPSRLTGLV
jgi:hypothetical protein